MVIKKYIKEYSMKEKYLLQITLKGSQSSQWISENLSQFMIHGGLIQVSEKKKVVSDNMSLQKMVLKVLTWRLILVSF